LSLAFLSTFRFGLVALGFVLEEGLAAGMVKVQFVMGPKNC
jgi:hypothetical protein